MMNKSATKESSLDKFRSAKLAAAGAVLSMLALSACSNESATDVPLSPVATASADASPTATPDQTPSVSPSPEKPLIDKVDYATSGIQTTQEAADMLGVWRDSLNSELPSNPNLMIDAAGVNGKEAQAAAITAMSEQLHLTPQEISIGTKVLARQVELIKPYEDNLEKEELKDAAELKDLGWTAFKQYNATRAWLRIMGEINNGLSDGSIAYPETTDKCDFTEPDGYIQVSTSKGSIYQDILLPPFGMQNTVSRELFDCTDEQLTSITTLRQIVDTQYKESIKFEKQKGRPYGAKALEAFYAPYSGSDQVITSLVSQLKS